jgi:hypothetical protein
MVQFTGYTSSNYSVTLNHRHAFAIQVKIWCHFFSSENTGIVLDMFMSIFYTLM